MGIILLLILAGMLIGYPLRQKERFLKANKTLINIAIYGLLFLLGVSLGSDAELLTKLPMLGGYALALSTLAVLGSILLAAVLYHKVFKKMEKNNEE